VPVVVFSLLRLALLGACLAALWFVGLRGWLLLLIGAFAALALSYVLLAAPRTAAAEWLAARAERRKAAGERFVDRLAQDAAVEDEALESGVVHDRASQDEQADAASEPARQLRG
jgi:hypothetical protein